MLKKLTLALSILTLLISCDGNKGALLFQANGEDFIAEGLTSKEGWDITFDSLLVNLERIEAYNADGLSALLEKGGHIPVDLAEGTPDGPSVPVGTMDVEAGNYQSLKFSLARIGTGENEGYSVVIRGTASRDGRSVPFRIRLNEELTFDGEEGYVGDTIKGLVKKGETSDVEMTFHFDHLFGNGDASPEDHVNTRSPGFDFFLKYGNDGKVDIGQDALTADPRYDDLIYAIESLGHLGEGHCEVSR